ncbi:hypothetical protein ACPPVT_13395 [Angustibacter sp. McL0619]|uniref:hypothetical protein n=1 Tax=Angustibacter sp. McL0619 TaxID=3415676 RepID=UPI003CE88B16
MVHNVTTTTQALRIMGVWVRRADAVLSQGAIANAAHAVETERGRVARQERELDAVNLTREPVRLAG